jgi:hypothetical protein
MAFKKTALSKAERMRSFVLQFTVAKVLAIDYERLNRLELIGAFSASASSMSPASMAGLVCGFTGNQ